jgi:hypothetical protein
VRIGNHAHPFAAGSGPRFAGSYGPLWRHTRCEHRAASRIPSTPRKTATSICRSTNRCFSFVPAGLIVPLSSGLTPMLTVLVGTVPKNLSGSRMRRSTCISRRQADLLRDAFHRAQNAARAAAAPLNLYIVLNFDHAGPWDFAGAFQTLRRNHFTRWLRHHTGGRVPPYYVWCLEHVSRPGFGANYHARSAAHARRCAGSL